MEENFNKSIRLPSQSVGALVAKKSRGWAALVAVVVVVMAMSAACRGCILRPVSSAYRSSGRARCTALGTHHVNQ